MDFHTSKAMSCLFRKRRSKPDGLTECDVIKKYVQLGSEVPSSETKSVASAASLEDCAAVMQSAACAAFPGDGRFQGCDEVGR